MIKSLAAAVALTLAASTAGTVLAAPVPAAAPDALSSKSSLNALMGNEAAKAVLEKYIPDVVAQIEPYIGQIPDEFTLDSLKDYGVDVPDDVRAKIDADLAKL